MQDKIVAMLQAEEDYLSGQEICDRLGVSRTAVWKVIKKLRAEGYDWKAIGEMYNVDKSTVCKVYNRWRKKQFGI